MPKGKLHGTLKGLGIPYTVDFTNADDDAHEYSVKKLMEKFGPKGDCTLLDYILFYGEYLVNFKGENVND